MANFFRKYSLIILLMGPLFIVASTTQHAIDLQNFLPTEQGASNIPAFPGSEVLEEISSEDDIHSLHFIISQALYYPSDSDYLLIEENVLNQIVPTPPPDLA